MNYEQTLEYLYSRLPIYQNKGVTAYKADIGNISKASNQLGNPHKKFKIPLWIQRSFSTIVW